MTQHSDDTVIDLRSDTVTKPVPAMLAAMMAAEVGDDVFGEDPTVNRLQEMVAELLGKEAALFIPSGTMGNQIAIRALTQPGDELICEANSHFLHYESGGIAAISGVHARTIVGEGGVFSAEQAAQLIRSAAHYFPRTRLITVENTHNAAGGRVWPLAAIRALRKMADANGLAMHLDGARLWNACAACGITAHDYAALFDTVSVCFSKGLGAPVGSAVAGNTELIQRARRIRKMLGGAMRQAGYLAAAAIYALQHHRDRLQEDHQHARRLAEALDGAGGLRTEPQSVETNIVMIDISQTRFDSTAALQALRQENLWVVPFGPERLRAVTHLNLSPDMIERAIAAFHKVFGTSR